MEISFHIHYLFTLFPPASSGLHACAHNYYIIVAELENLNSDRRTGYHLLQNFIINRRRFIYPLPAFIIIYLDILLNVNFLGISVGWFSFSP
jgi:hypothetical protein